MGELILQWEYWIFPILQKLFVARRHVVYAEMEEIGLAVAIVYAWHHRFAQIIFVQIESTQYIASFPEYSALRLVSRSLRSITFGTIGTVQSSRSRYIDIGSSLSVKTLNQFFEFLNDSITEYFSIPQRNGS